MNCSEQVGSKRALFHSNLQNQAHAQLFMLPLTSILNSSLGHTFFILWFTDFFLTKSKSEEGKK